MSAEMSVAAATTMISSPGLGLAFGLGFGFGLGLGSGSGSGLRLAYRLAEPYP